MPDQPNKPGGDFDEDGAPRDVEEEQAVKNQGTTTPEKYPRGEGRASGEDTPGSLAP